MCSCVDTYICTYVHVCITCVIHEFVAGYCADLTFQLAMGGGREDPSCIAARSPKWSTDESVKALG